MTLKLDLGSGRQASEAPGYIHIDKWMGDGIDIQWDLEKGLPKRESLNDWIMAVVDNSASGKLEDSIRVFKDNSVDEIRAHHCLEHIQNLMPLFDEMWDALKPDGVLHIWVPNAHHIKAAWSDPTHVRTFTPETFDYWTPSTLSAFPYTERAWEYVMPPRINGTPPDDLWEIETILRPIK